MDDLFSVKDYCVVVTGGAQGIGRCVADALAERGAKIAILDIQKEKAAAAAREIAERTGMKVQAYACDVTDAQQVDDIMTNIAVEYETIDAVFNNAGIVLHKPAEQVTAEEWRRILDVNVNGVFNVAKAAARTMLDQEWGGSIVNTASMSGLIVNVPQCQASYNTSKAAVIHMTKSLAVEWAAYDVRVNCISPGYIATEMTDRVDPEWRAHWERTIPKGRMGRPDELVGAVIYLMSAASSYTTGLNLVIDGGFTCV